MQVILYTMLFTLVSCTITGMIALLSILRRLKMDRIYAQSQAATVPFPRRFVDRVITEERPKTPKPLMQRANLPPGLVINNEIAILVEPDATEPLMTYRRYVDKDGTTRRHMRRIIDHIENVQLPPPKSRAG